MKLIFHSILGFQLKEFQYDESRLLKEEIITVVKSIERRLFDRLYSYFPPFNEENITHILQHYCKQLLLDKLDSAITQKAEENPTPPEPQTMDIEHEHEEAPTPVAMSKPETAENSRNNSRNSSEV